MSDMMAQAADRFEVLGQLSMKANEDMHQRISNLELFLADRLDIIEYQLKSQQKNTPKPNV
jgi:dsDNA-binding SOS-regulon protein